MKASISRFWSDLNMRRNSATRVCELDRRRGISNNWIVTVPLSTYPESYETPIGQANKVQKTSRREGLAHHVGMGQ
jgi:hypothetical protein